ncbi:OsmC-like protein [Aciduliprofundum boonei T469]|nr:OsmC-like protein [Aciduliprofundum boonei T469]
MDEKKPGNALENIDFEALGDLLAAESVWIGDGRTKTKIHDLELEVDNPLSVSPINPPPHVTWPEQLLPAALAVCFITTMTAINEKIGVHINELRVIVRPILGIDTDRGFKFDKMKLNVKLSIARGEKSKAEKLVEITHKYCLVSKAIKGNVEEIIEVDIKEVD